MLPVYRSAACVALVLVTAACGSSPSTPTTASPPSSGGSTGGGTPPPGSPVTTITVSSAGVSPSVLTVPVGTKVTFTNVDNRPHDFSGGPDPSHPECPEIDQAGFVAAGQSRDTGVFTTARTCQYHDHTFIGVPAFQGRIVIE